MTVHCTARQLATHLLLHPKEISALNGKGVNPLVHSLNQGRTQMIDGLALAAIATLAFFLGASSAFIGGTAVIFLVMGGVTTHSASAQLIEKAAFDTTLRTYLNHLFPKPYFQGNSHILGTE